MPSGIAGPEFDPDPEPDPNGGAGNHDGTDPKMCCNVPAIAISTKTETIRLHSDSTFTDLALALSGEVRVMGVLATVTFNGTSALSGNLYGPGLFAIDGNSTVNGLKIRDSAFVTKAMGSSEYGTMSIRSPESSRTML